MKTRLLTFKSLLLICVLAIVGGAQAWAQTYTYKKILSEDELISGGKCLIVCEDQNVAMADQQKKGRSKESVKIKNGQIEISSAQLENTKIVEFTMEKNNEGKWTFFDPKAKGYLQSPASKNQLTTATKIAKGCNATLSFDGEGNVKILFDGISTSNSNILWYNTQAEEYDGFRCYGSGSVGSTFKTIQLYRKIANTSITHAGYSTFYSEEAFLMPTGIVGNTINSKDGSLVINAAYEGGAIVPAKTALLLKGEAKDYVLTFVSSDKTAPVDNLLHGTTTDAMTNAGEGNYKYYKLSYDDNDANLGFYWGAENGAAFTNKAGKAYLAVPVTEGQSMAKGFSLSDLTNGTTTSIQQASIADKAVPIFDINGRRVSTLNGAAKGVYIVGGKKVMVK
jgi:hypothetical protein